MPAHVRAVSFALTSQRDRLVFFDAFVKNRRLVLVSTYYPDQRVDFGEVEVNLDGVLLRDFEEIGLNGMEATRAIVYPLGDLASLPRHELTVRYRGQKFNAALATEATAARKAFAVATLFRDDAALIEPFYRYYKQQGVERFYLFYNGDLSTVRSRLFVADDIVYGEWDFTYLLDLRSKAFTSQAVDLEAAVNPHHAQTAFLTMVRYRYLPDCSYLALIDLDEFLSVAGETVRANIERVGALTLTVPCHWAELRPLERWMPRRLWRSRNFRVLQALGVRGHRALQRRFGNKGIRAAPLRLEFSDLGRLWANPESVRGKRAKTIYRGDYDGLFNIHTPKPPAQIRMSEQLKLYHIVNGHGRHTQMHPNAAPLSLIGA